jgi:hypothetical protein
MVELPAYLKEIAGGNDAHRAGRWVTASIRFSPRGPPSAGAIPTRRPFFLNINDDPGVVYS